MEYSEFEEIMMLKISYFIPTNIWDIMMGLWEIFKSYVLETFL